MRNKNWSFTRNDLVEKGKYFGTNNKKNVFLFITRRSLLRRIRFKRLRNNFVSFVGWKGRPSLVGIKIKRIKNYKITNKKTYINKRNSYE